MATSNRICFFLFQILFFTSNFKSSHSYESSEKPPLENSVEHFDNASGVFHRELKPSSKVEEQLFSIMNMNMTNLLATQRSGNGSEMDVLQDIVRKLINPLAKRMGMTPDELLAFQAKHNLTIPQLIEIAKTYPSEPPPTTTSNVPEPEDECYCSSRTEAFATYYRSIHGYVSLVVCLFGTVANVLNVAVLTKKDMAGASINRILTALAIADMLVMLEYVPFSCYMYLIFRDNKQFPFSWAVFILFHMHFTQLLHTISICLTLALAVWRYIVIRFPQHSRVWCTDRRCTLAIFISYTLPFLVCSPSYLVFKIRSTVVTENSQDEILYHIGPSDVAKEGHEFLYQFNFWVYGVVIKLLPCAILTVISCWLIKALYRVNKRKQALKGYSNCNAEQKGERRAISRPEKKTYRTTRMLLAVLLLFLITELPQGIMGLLSGVLGKCFFENCYHRFGEFMDILALLNGAINFILYCSMSRQFRTNFGQLFKPRNVLAKWAPSQTSVQSTYV